MERDTGRLYWILALRSRLDNHDVCNYVGDVVANEQQIICSIHSQHQYWTL